jgi:hypothetical protein
LLASYSESGSGVSNGRYKVDLGPLKMEYLERCTGCNPTLRMRKLTMEIVQSPLYGVTMIALDEIDVDSRFSKTTTIPGFHEEAEMLLLNPRLD